MRSRISQYLDTQTLLAWRALGLWTVVGSCLLLSVANGGRCCEWGLVLRMGARRGEIAGFVANGGSNVGRLCEWGLRGGAIAGFGALRSLRSQFIFRETAPSARIDAIFLGHHSSPTHASVEGPQIVPPRARAVAVGGPPPCVHVLLGSSPTVTTTLLPTSLVFSSP